MAAFFARHGDSRESDRTLVDTLYGFSYENGGRIRRRHWLDLIVSTPVSRAMQTAGLVRQELHVPALRADGRLSVASSGLLVVTHEITVIDDVRRHEPSRKAGRQLINALRAENTHSQNVLFISDEIGSLLVRQLEQSDASMASDEIVPLEPGEVIEIDPLVITKNFYYANSESCGGSGDQIPQTPDGSPRE